MTTATDRDPASPRGTASFRERCAVALLLTAFVALNVSVSSRTSKTIDEPVHVAYGSRVLRGEPHLDAPDAGTGAPATAAPAPPTATTGELPPGVMPVSALNALPAFVAERLPPGSLRDRLEGLAATRLATTAAAALLGLLVWSWSRSLYGAAGGALTLGLFVLDPNFLAHSHLATTDVYAALGICAACWGGWRAARAPSWRTSLAAGVLLGGAQLTKYFALLLYPLLAAIALARARRGRGEKTRVAPAPLEPVARTALLIAASLLTVHAGFGFDRAFSKLRSFDFRSDPMIAIAELDPVGSMPAPLPDAYVVGFDRAIESERTTHTFGRIYLLGRVSADPVPGYYLVASLFKVPLPTLLVGLLLLLRLPRLLRRGEIADNEIFLLAPIATFAVYLNFFYNAQIGIRHFLVVFPLGYVLAGALLRDGWPTALRPRLGWSALALWQLVSVAAAFPYYIPYFNELIPDRKLAYRVLSDSNVDWGQARGELRQWLALHPEAHWRPTEPVSGRVVVRVNAITGVLDGERFAWLRPLRPVGHIGYSYLIFDVSPEFAEAARLRAGDAGAATADDGIPSAKP